jgi:outer membrane protein TolC
MQTMPIHPRARCSLFSLVFSMLAGCAAYQPQSLDDAPPSACLAPSAASVAAAAQRLPPLAGALARGIDPAAGLDMTDVTLLALVNNPDLALARGDAAVARAQAFSAGLLPDPQLALAGDLNNNGPDGIRAFSVGLNYDINALLLHAASRDAAGHDARKADLNLLWAEWQVVAQARLLFVKVRQGERAMAVLDETRALYDDRLRRVQAALRAGLIGSDAVAPQLASQQDVQRQTFEMRRQVDASRHALNALLGVAPATALMLRDGDGLADFVGTEAAARAALPDLPARRPDLLALRAAWDVQDQRYRGALLAQYPALNLGFTRARDSSGIDSNGVGLTLSLPFLNRNRGNVAIEQATRQKLRDDYLTRLQAGRNDILRLLDEQALNRAQLAENRIAVTALTATLAQSDTGYRAGNLDLLAYAGARGGLLARQLEGVALEQALQEQAIAIATLLGFVLPAASTESTAP